MLNAVIFIFPVEIVSTLALNVEKELTSNENILFDIDVFVPKEELILLP